MFAYEGAASFDISTADGFEYRLVLGYTFAVIAVVDMSAVAGLLGGTGLGNYAITYGYRQFDDLITWSALVVIVVIVQLVQLLGNVLARRVLRR